MKKINFRLKRLAEWSFVKQLLKWFLQGLVIFVPAVFTLLVVIWVFGLFDAIFTKIFRVKIWGLGFVLTIAAITAIGFFASNFLGKKFFALIDRIFRKLPFIKLLYSSAKDFIEAFAGREKSFDKPVVVEVLKGGPLALGFVTREDLSMLGLKDHVAVYFPQSYNFAGSVLLCENWRVRPLQIDASVAMAFIVSGGITGRSEQKSVVPPSAPKVE